MSLLRLDPALACELVEFDLDQMLEYASAVGSKAPEPVPPPQDDEFPVLRREWVCLMQSPVPLVPLVLAQYELGGLTRQQDCFEFATDAVEVKAGTPGQPLIIVYKRARRNMPRGVLASMNVADTRMQHVAASELRFLLLRLKKCRLQFLPLHQSWRVLLLPALGEITVSLVYALNLKVLFHRQFQPPVSQSLMLLLSFHIEELPIEPTDQAGDVPEQDLEQLAVAFQGKPDTHLFYKVMIERTLKLPPAKESFRHPRLQTELLPFQKRSVEWLLRREAVKYTGKEAALVPLITPALHNALASFPHIDPGLPRDWLDTHIQLAFSRLCFGWRRVLFQGDVCWCNAYTGNMLTEAQAVAFFLSCAAEQPRLPGCGLLLEEMGLGKTVEITSLILFNPRPQAEVGLDMKLRLQDEGDERWVRQAKTTIIAAPESILRQWYSELRSLCPTLLVVIYKGLGKYPELRNIPKYIAEYLLRFDVVLMNYATLGKETDYATYSSRHIPTRGGQKRTREPDGDHQTPNWPDQDNPDPAATADMFKADFQLPTDEDSGLRQRHYDRAVMAELVKKLHTDTRTIPHTQYYESPLMLYQWWRVVLDEVQMVSSGSTRAFTTAALVPRFHSWGVSGTPTTLPAVLKFLRVAPFEGDNAKYCWKLLTLPQRPNHDFVRIWLQLAIRHTKRMVHDDIKLPPQHRVLLTIPFTEVEQDKYNELLARALGPVPDGGVNLSPSDCTHLRSWLVKLRQLCGNLQVGKLVKTQLVRGKHRSKILVNSVKELKTLEGVLDDMIKAVAEDIGDAEKTVINRVLELCQALEYSLFPEKVIDVLGKVSGQISALLSQATETADLRNSEYKKVRSLLISLDALPKTDMGDLSDSEEPALKLEENSDEQIEEALSKYQSLKEQVAASRARIRSWKMTQHKCFFLLASAHFQLYDPEYRKKVDEMRVDFKALEKVDSVVDQCGFKQQVKEEEVKLLKQEDSDTVSDDPPEVQEYKRLELMYYELAEQCRKSILKHPIHEAETIIRKRITDRPAIRKGDWVNLDKPFPKLSKKLFLALPMIETSNIAEVVGPRCQRVIQQYLQMVEKLNTQANVINDYMEQLATILANPLWSVEKEADGAEYEQSLEDQDKSNSLMLVITQMLADRTHATLESKSLIIEVKKQQEREFKLEAQRITDRKFLRVLQNERTRVKPESPLSLEEILHDCRYLEIELQDLNYALLEVFLEVNEVLRTTFENEKTCQALMRRALNLDLNAVFNVRVEYFKHLQQISDSVENKLLRFPQNEMTAHQLDELFSLIFNNITLAQARLFRAVSRNVYLQTLVPGSQSFEPEAVCIICQCAITVGSLTSCGHKFCKLCLDEWFIRQPRCPLCKTYNDRNTIYEFTQNKASLQAHHIVAAEPEKAHVPLVYKQLDDATLKKIQRTKLDNSFGLKVDTLVKQVLFLRLEDPETQIVIFSQWQDLLVILAYAFDKLGITYVSAKGLHVATHKYKKTDPIEEFKDKTQLKTCFLLNAQAQSSGLTLINATHIILCEPLINTPTELQAILRIHRIGQKRETTVWMMAIADTVEERIVALGTRKRVEYLRANAKEDHEQHPEVEDIADDEIEDLEERDLRTAESFALTVAPTEKRSNTTEYVDDGDLAYVYFDK